jgi:putative ABC transport system permease protein
MAEVFKNIFYFAKRFTVPTSLNLLGLVVAFSSFYLMMSQIIYQVTYNHDVEDYKRIYRLDTDYMVNEYEFHNWIHFPFTKALDSLPEVESVSQISYSYDDSFFLNIYNVSFRDKDGERMKSSYYFCNKTAISTLSSKILSGDIEWKDQKPSTIDAIIPESIAKQYFGKTDVANDTMWVDDEYGAPTQILIIKGVYKDFPTNSELKNGIYLYMGDEKYYKRNFNISFTCFVKFKQEPKDVDALNQKFKKAVYNMMERDGWENYTAAVDEIPGYKQAIKNTHFRFTPIAYSYFERGIDNSGEYGYKAMFIVLALACQLLIILAINHFLNFTIVQSPMRVHSMNTRLVLGATRQQLRLGIFAECVVISIFACFIALMLCSALASLPVVEKLINGDISPLNHWALSLSMFILAAAVGMAAGTYPAFFVTSFVPAMALKGDFGLTPQGNKLRKTVLCIQLFASSLMVIYMGILIDEHRFIFKSSYGFNKNQVLVSTLPLEIEGDADVKKELYEELMALPGVKSVAWSDGTMGLSDVHYKHGINVNNQNLVLEFSAVDTAYLRTMGIKVIEGRDFIATDTAAIIISKSAQQQWKWIKIGMRIPFNGARDSVTVVGVCEDTRYNTTRLQSNQPFSFVTTKRTIGMFNLFLSVNKDADLDDVRQQANAILHEHFGKEARSLMSYDKKLEESYDNELRFFKWFYFICVVFMVITLIGVFCMTMFETEYRRKEIGIRKIAGARTSEVVWMMSWQYIPLVLISFVLATPLAIYCGQKTLDYFADHVGIHWWTIALSLALVGAITLGTIALQCWRIARENPVNSIKTE